MLEDDFPTETPCQKRMAWYVQRVGKTEQNKTKQYNQNYFTSKFISQNWNTDNIPDKGVDHHKTYLTKMLKRHKWMKKRLQLEENYERKRSPWQKQTYSKGSR